MPKKFPGKREVGSGGHDQRGTGGAEGEGGGTWSPMRTRNMDNRRPVVRPVPSTSTPRRRIDPLPLESLSAPSTSEAQQEGSPEMDPIARAVYRNRVEEEWANAKTRLMDMAEAIHVEMQEKIAAARDSFTEMLGDRQVGRETEDMRKEGMSVRVGEADDATPNPVHCTCTNSQTHGATNTNALTDAPTERVEEVHQQTSGVGSTLSVLPGYHYYALPKGTTGIHLPSNSAPQVHPMTVSAPQVHPMTVSAPQVHPMTVSAPQVHPMTVSAPQVHPITVSAPPVHPITSSAPQMHPMTASVPQTDPGIPGASPGTTMGTGIAPRSSSFGDQSQQMPSANWGRKLPEVGEVPTFNGDPPGASGALAAGSFLRKIEMETQGPRWNDALRIILTRKQLRGTAKETWMDKTTEMENWENFKQEFKETFQIPRVLNDAYLHTYAPPRKPGESLAAYVNRVHSYLDNFHPDGNMDKDFKLAQLKHILFQELPKPVCGALYTAETLKEVIRGIEIASYTFDWLRLAPAAIAHEKPPGSKADISAAGAVTASTVAAVTSHGRGRGDRRPQKTPTSYNIKQGTRGRGRSGPSKGNATDSKGWYSRPVKRARRPEHSNRSRNGCWNCGGDHRRSECPKGVVCFKCNQEGHVASNCWAKEQKNKKGAEAFSKGTPVAQTSQSTVGTTVGGPSCPSYYPFGTPVAAPISPFPMLTHVPSANTGAPQLSLMWGTPQGSTPSPGGTVNLSSGTSTPNSANQGPNNGSQPPPPRADRQ